MFNTTFSSFGHFTTNKHATVNVILKAGKFNRCRTSNALGIIAHHYLRNFNRQASNTARDLKNKVIVVTGGADGIGYEMADKYLQKGAKITILLDFNEKLGAEAEKKLNAKYGNNKAVFRPCDVTKDMDSICKWIFDCYKVDVLVNNAGTLDQSVVKRIIDTNVTAVVEWGLTFWHHMRKDKGGNGGTIINLASIYGYRVDQFLPVYQSTKFAVMGFTKSLGHIANFNRSGVRVVAICPGFTVTRMTDNPKTLDMGHDKEFAQFLKAQLWQKVEAVGFAALDVFQKAPTGTAWLTEGNKPVVEVANQK